MTDAAGVPTTVEEPSPSSTWKSRAWPGVAVIAAPWLHLTRGFGSGPGPGSSLMRAAVRKLCMWEILALRVVASVLMIVGGGGAGGGGRGAVAVAVRAAVGGALLVVDVLSVLWSLALVCRAEGRRRVLSHLTVGRNHLDGFLGVCALLHAVLFVMVLGALNAVGLDVFGLALWMLIVAYGFICTARPDGVS